MARIAMVESESRRSPAPTPVPAAPEPAVLAAAIRELGHLLRVSSHVVHKLVPSPLASDLVDLIDRRLRDIEASLGAAE